MTGYKVLVFRITDKSSDDTSSYCRENSDQLYEQKVERLDLQQLIAVVNGLQKPQPIVVSAGMVNIDELLNNKV